MLRSEQPKYCKRLAYLFGLVFNLDLFGGLIFTIGLSVPVQY